ncbi:Uncharacterized protein TCM_013096 [Theobroma cacao]|uniref:Uncharacterized protein n=1 Tax=Theobroma cacao TaxID=3641 RepID=A0A061FX85_THECC|nr:Uncharacterized protein TCM_013096 [Theobroma cacao]
MYCSRVVTATLVMCEKLHEFSSSVGVGDDHPTGRGVILEDLIVGLQSLAHEFAEFHNRDEAHSVEWVDSSSQDLEYLP